jgi:excinuclease ABC subunit A
VTIGSEPIELRGVRVHNLKNVSVDIPRGQLVAICGVSGSGKTSLALDTLYAEGQRRYIESFSAYTRQFLARLDKPDCDSINHLPPALAVTRAGTYRGNRTTVGTASEVLEYLRVLFAKVAELRCSNCNQPIASQSPQTVTKAVEQLPKCKVMICFEVEWQDTIDRAMALADLQAAGFVRFIAGNQMIHIPSVTRDDLATLFPEAGKVLVVVDRVKGGVNQDGTRLTESLENAMKQGNGEVVLLVEEVGGPFAVDGADWKITKFSQQLRCSACDIEYLPATAQLFNFNSPLGACPTCEGFGDTVDFDLNQIVPDRSKSIRDGAIAPWNSPSYQNFLDELLGVARRLKVPIDVPFDQLTTDQIQRVMEGDAGLGYSGIQGFFAWLERKKYKMHVRVFLSRWRSYNRCRTCDGQRLNPRALAYRMADKNFSEICALEIDALIDLLQSLELTASHREISKTVHEQTLHRLNCLKKVGLGYLALNRPLRTLSGGEAQRTLLTTALGSSLVNMLYVLDEPTVGLHPHDVEQLSRAIVGLTDRGNTVVVVEHEEAILNKADLLIEVGPKAGEQGGSVVFQGTKETILSSNSLTGDYMSGRKKIAIPGSRRSFEKAIQISGCVGNNLKNIDVSFPLGALCAVTGVSGSGKSSLVQDTLFAAISNKRLHQAMPCLPYNSLTGIEKIQDCILIDQSPVSRSPRSNPVTFIKAFDEIRKTFAESLDAKTRNFTASHFSFNSDLGRCQTCEGDGVLQIDMQFLADVTMTCSSCNGDRYRPEVLTVRHRDLNIAQVLKLTVREAIGFFRGFPAVQSKLNVLVEVGLEYLQLGQSALTLSSGEAQRLKLASYLASTKRPRTLFIFDEPTTGLHPQDIGILIRCFNKLIESGHSLIVIEHNLHVVAAADYIIDLGPGAADAGGQIVGVGTPEVLSQNPSSVTGRYLQDFLAR